MNTIQFAEAWIRDGLVMTKLRPDYTIVKDPATGRKLYLPKLKGTRRHLGQMFTTPRAALEYRRKVVRRCWRWKEVAHAAEDQ